MVARDSEIIYVKSKVRRRYADGKIRDPFCRMYAGKRIFLEIELPGKEYENNLQRTRRKDFYLRNGLKEGGTRMKIYDTDMELLVFDKPVGFGEYLELFRLGMGDFIKITGEPEEK